MKKTLQALMTRLDWQLSELGQQLQTLSTEEASLQEKITATEQAITRAYCSSTLINPEQEIARLNFIMQQQSIEEGLNLQLKELQRRKTQLQDQQLRLNSELKMLNTYQQKQQKAAQAEDLRKQQNTSDEWTLLRREAPNENQ